MTETQTLPSQFQIGDEAVLNLWGTKINCAISSIQFYKSKVRYDIYVFGEGNDDLTTLRGVDSAFIEKKP